MDTAPADLKPGQWVWSPGLAADGPVLVVVNLDEQRAYAYRNAVRIGVADVSTGKKGHETPTGVFHTLQKDRDHRSSTYNNAPMPFTQRLTWDGVALHAGGLPGYPSSHGCVHLPSAFAEALFAVSPMGMTVVVARGSSTPLDLMHPLPVSPVDPATGSVEHEPRLDPAADARWTESAPTSGPLALVASMADRRVLVMRHGVEIARARFTTPAQAPVGTHAFVAQLAAGAVRWVGVAVPGHADDAGRVLTPAAMARVRLPRDFQLRLSAAVEPGSTLVVTDAEILPHTTGASLTVLTNQPPES